LKVPASDHPLARSDYPGRTQDRVSVVGLQQLAEVFLCDLQTPHHTGNRVAIQPGCLSKHSSSGKPHALSFPTSKNITKSEAGALFGGSKAQFVRWPLRLEVFPLPKYSPELNTQERLWHYTRREATHNRFFEKPADLCSSLFRTFDEVQKHTEKIRGLLAPFF
jgi:hypothetical protein